MKKVLVVDDNPDILEVIQLVLELEGFEVRCCEDGGEVLSEIGDFHPDVIILDVMLGDLDGREICSSLKKDKQTREIPVMMISASHTMHDVKLKQCKAEDYISKPFDIDALATKVSRLAS